MPILKSAPTRKEVNKIKVLNAQGLTVREIGQRLRVKEPAIQNWVNHYNGETKDAGQPAPT